MTPKSLAESRVHVAGVGRVGTAVVLGLHEAGVGSISCNDPQRFELEQLASSSYARRSDLGKYKVHALEQFLDGRPGLAFLPMVGRNESPRIESSLNGADVIVSCANKLNARLHVERTAVRLGKPCIQACVQDAQLVLGGTVSVWAGRRDRACFGCLFPSGAPRRRRNEVLLPSVTRLVASIAVNVVIKIALGEFGVRENLFSIDASRLSIAAFSIGARPCCPVCSIRKPILEDHSC